MVPGTTTVTELCCFLGFWFFFFLRFFPPFLLMECAGRLSTFVQMTAEPGKAVAAIDA